jgi:hypothetical protein
MNNSNTGRKTAVVPAGYRWRFCLALLAVLLACRAWGVEINDLVVTTGKGEYTIEMSLQVSAPASRVIAVLTDFGYPDPVNPDVSSREVISVTGNVTRVRTEFEGCVLFICRDVELIQDVRVDDDEIFADVVPGGKSFRSGQLYWRIVDDGNTGSDIDFRASMQHNLFVMPLIGGFFLRKRIRAALLESVENLEKAAAR